MIEKVNPSHPDKIADRIAGAIVDLAYQVQPDPKIAVEVLIGHGVCHVIVETSAPLLMPEAVRAIHNAIRRIAGLIQIDGDYYYVKTSNCEVVHGRTYWVTVTNGLLPSAQYTFADDGKMILE